MRYHFKPGPPWANEFFRGHGFRCTFPRQLILDVFYNSTKHLSAEDVYLMIHKTHPEIGLTTVYRTIEILNKLGIIEKLDVGDGRARFELSHSLCKKGHHHHLVCTGCGIIIDYDDFMKEETELVKKIENHLKEKHNFTISGHMLQFYGLCPKCKEKNDEGKTSP